MKRILVATHNYPRFESDPAGAFVARVARTFRDKGDEVSVVTPHAPGAPRGVRTEHGIDVNRFRYGPEFMETVAYSADMSTGKLLGPGRLLPLPLFLAAFRRNLIREVARFQPDVIHAHWWFPCGWVARKLGVPLLITCHGSDVRLIERAAVVRRMARSVFRRAGVTTAVSQFLAADAQRLTGMDEPPVRVTHMPLDVDLWAQGLDALKVHPPRVVYAGNLVASKGVDLLIRAVSELFARGRECELRILGEGAARKGLEQLAHDVGVTDRVEFSDFVPQSAMPEEYGRATIAVLPTRGNAEGLGLTLAEALLAGCAIVGSPAGGIPEIIDDGYTGLIFRDGDASHLAERLEYLLEHQEERDKMTRAGRAMVVERHSSAAAHERFELLYRETIESHASR